MDPFDVNNTSGHHLGRHLVFSELRKDARVASLGFVMFYVFSFENAKTFSIDGIARHG